jgi:hypothetical protein
VIRPLIVLVMPNACRSAAPFSATIDFYKLNPHSELSVWNLVNASLTTVGDSRTK